MPLIGQISAQLSADTSDFRTKIADANASVENFGKGAGKLGGMFGGAFSAVTGLVGRLGLAGAAIGATVKVAGDLWDRLKSSREATDANVQSAQRLQGAIGEAAEGMKKLYQNELDAVIKAVGWVASLGEVVGKQIAILKYGREQVEVTEKIAAQTQATLAALEKDRALNEQIAKVKERTREAEKKNTEEAEKRLDLTDRILLAEQKIAAARDAIAAAGDDRLAVAKAELELATARGESDKLRAEQSKALSAEEKKAAEERAKEVEAFARLNAELDEEEKTRYYEKLERQKELEDARRRAGEVALRAESAVLEKIEQQNQALAVGFQIRGRYDDQLSDRVLEDKIQTLSRSIQAREFALRGGGGVGGGGVGYDPLLGFERAELDRAKDELQARTSIRKQVGAYGEDATAARFYKGNVAEFERLLQFVGDPSVQQKQLDRLTELVDRVAASPWFERRR